MFIFFNIEDQLQFKKNVRSWRLRRQILIYIIYAIGIAASWPFYGLCVILFLLALSCIWSFS